jgi:hypothetical protein
MLRESEQARNYRNRRMPLQRPVDIVVIKRVRSGAVYEGCLPGRHPLRAADQAGLGVASLLCYFVDQYLDERFVGPCDRDTQPIQAALPGQLQNLARQSVEYGSRGCARQGRSNPPDWRSLYLTG